MTMQRGLTVGLVVAAAVGGWLALPAAEKSAAPVKIEVSKGHIDFKAGDKLTGRYHIAPGVAKPYFWPLNAPSGVTVTRGWPMDKAGEGDEMDHVHQKSAWFCHGDIIPEGMEIKHKIKGVEGVDFWSEN